MRPSYETWGWKLNIYLHKKDQGEKFDKFLLFFHLEIYQKVLFFHRFNVKISMMLLLPFFLRQRVCKERLYVLRGLHLVCFRVFLGVLR